ncbi:MAG: GNAT family N-acetyltransferase [Thermoguttaceae bacterium]
MLRLLQMTSVDELRFEHSAWDDLWRRSEVTLPTARAETVALWIEQFAPRAEIRVLVVEDGGRWIAALPLIAGDRTGLVERATLPANAWPCGGDLLWDPAAAGDACAGALLAEALRRLPWHLLMLEGARPERQAWQSLLLALDRAAIPCDLRARWQVPRMAIDHDWEAFWARLSPRHRQKMTAHLRRLADRGTVQFRLHSQFAPHEVAAGLRQAFEIEDRGWKGAGGTSVLRTPGLFAFFLRQARRLAAWGQLELAFLHCGGKPVAFCYGMSAKGVFHSCKIGYDPAYSEQSPGHLLQYHLLRHLQADPQRSAIDYVGPMTEYHAHWRPGSYGVARLAVAPRYLGRLALGGYRLLKGPDARTSVGPACQGGPWPSPAEQPVVY